MSDEKKEAVFEAEGFADIPGVPNDIGSGVLIHFNFNGQNISLLYKIETVPTEGVTIEKWVGELTTACSILLGNARRIMAQFEQGQDPEGKGH